MKEKQQQQQKTVMHPDIVHTWYQTSGCLETLPDYFTSHLDI